MTLSAVMTLKTEEGGQEPGNVDCIQKLEMVSSIEFIEREIGLLAP